MIRHGDCLEVMAGMEPESVDAIVTDPPYGLGFMGKAWDHAAGSADSPMRRRPEVDAVNAGMSRQGGRQWAGTDGQKRQARDARGYQSWCQEWGEVALWVAKPSAYILSFGGTRTVHRLAAGLEDAGWIIRDMLVWAYASGFPKSKASLKPAWEPIVMARKPGPLRMLAIDECLIPLSGGEAVGGRDGEATADTRYGDKLAAKPGRRLIVSKAEPSLNAYGDGLNGSLAAGSTDIGRWPANVVLSEPVFGDAYSRFFLISKASRSDREPVLGGLTPGDALRVESAHSTVCARCGRQRVNVPGAACRCPEPEWVRKPQTARANVHPTVKPTDLMRHLVRLVTPTGGIVLDPFLGSGTTGLAAEMEGFQWVGIEREAEYVAIAEARLNGTQRGLGLRDSGVDPANRAVPHDGAAASGSTPDPRERVTRHEDAAQ